MVALATELHGIVDVGVASFVTRGSEAARTIRGADEGGNLAGLSVC